MFTIAESLTNMNLEIFIDESDIGNIKLDQKVYLLPMHFLNKK